MTEAEVGDGRRLRSEVEVLPVLFDDTRLLLAVGQVGEEVGAQSGEQRAAKRTGHLEVELVRFALVHRQTHVVVAVHLAQDVGLEVEDLARVVVDVVAGRLRVRVGGRSLPPTGTWCTS